MEVQLIIGAQAMHLVGELEYKARTRSLLSD
jgi:hypothetical protein